MRRFSLIAMALTAVFALQGCALNTFEPKPDDPAYAPALPEEDLTSAVPTGSLFNPYSTNNGLYTDTRAHKVGDLISVYLEEF